MSTWCPVGTHWTAALRPHNHSLRWLTAAYGDAERPLNAFPPGTMYSWSAWERGCHYGPSSATAGLPGRSSMICLKFSAVGESFRGP